MLTGREQEYCGIGRFFLDFDQHIAIFDFDGIDRDPGIRVVIGRAGLWVVRPAMPRAHDLAILDHALAERTSLMKADVVHSGVAAIHIGETDFFVAAGEFFGGVGSGEFGLRRQFGEWHTWK